MVAPLSVQVELGELSKIMHLGATAESQALRNARQIAFRVSVSQKAPPSQGRLAETHLKAQIHSHEMWHLFFFPRSLICCSAALYPLIFFPEKGLEKRQREGWGLGGGYVPRPLPLLPPSP